MRAKTGRGHASSSGRRCGRDERRDRSRELERERRRVVRALQGRAGRGGTQAARGAVVGEARGGREWRRPISGREPAHAHPLAGVVPAWRPPGGALSGTGPRGDGQRVPALRAPAKAAVGAREPGGVPHLRGSETVGRTRVGGQVPLQGDVRALGADGGAPEGVPRAAAAEKADPDAQEAWKRGGS